MKKSLALGFVAALFSINAFASDSRYPCDVKLFSGYSEDKKTHFTVCDNHDNVTVTLVDLTTNDVIDDIQVPKKNLVLITDGPVKMMTISRGKEKEEGGYGYIETTLPSRILMVASPEGKQVVIQMTLPEISIF